MEERAFINVYIGYFIRRFFPKTSAFCCSKFIFLIKHRYCYERKIENLFLRDIKNKYYTA